MKRARALLLYILLAAGFAAKAQPTDTADSKPLEKYPYVVVIGEKQPFELSDSAFYRISRKVIFPVNKYLIPENSAFRKEVERELMPYMNDSHHVLDRIVLRGAASPEGPYKWNEFLAEHRAQALYDLIKENSIFPLDSCNTRVEEPEDYIYLLLLMKERGDKDYAAVEAIVNQWVSKDQARLKEELQSYRRGRLWKRLLSAYFPELRAARVVLVFKKFHDFSMEKPLEPERSDLAVAEEVLAPPKSIPRLLLPEPKLSRPRRELLAIKTNLLYDFAYMPGYNRFCPIPNVAIEFFPLHGHFTFGASFDCPWWQDYDAHKYFQVRNYQLEARYYFRSGDVRKVGYDKGAAFKGWYLQAYGHLGLYDLCFDADRGWRGEGWGAGLGVGYVLPISKNQHWRLEFGAQVGYFQTDYDPYQWLCPVDPLTDGKLYYYKWTGKAEDFKERQYRFRWFGPTRIGITLSYDLLYRKRDHRGASFRSRERVR